MNVLKDKRIKAKLTIKQLADKTGLSPDTIYQLEHGKRNAQELTLGRLAEALGIDWQDLTELLNQKADKAPKLTAAKLLTV